MATDTLEIFGTEYQGVTGIKATDDNSQTKTYIRPQGTYNISANGTGIDVTQYASVDVAVNPTLETVSKSYTPTTSQQTETITPSTGYDGIGEVDVTVGAMPTATVTIPDITGSNASPVVENDKLTVRGVYSLSPTLSNAGYVASATARNVTISLGTQTSARTSSDMYIGSASDSGATVIAPTGFYASSASYTIQGGTQGTPTATKGTVSNHSILVTPSVTNSSGYITGGTKTGTAVTVSASELVSGSETKTQNGTYDVTNLAELVVNVSGVSSWQQIGTASFTVNTTSTSATAVGTIPCGSSLLTSDDIIWVHIRGSRGKSAGYYYGSDAYFLNTYPANSISGSYTVTTPAIITIRCASNGNYEIYSGQYGVYAYSLGSDGNVTIRRRYNSTYTLTINDTFTCTVYRLKFAGNAKMLV